MTGGNLYGRTEEEWDELVRVGRAFLIEQARMGRTTTYTELNAVLRQRAGARAFDFELESERAAMGQLLGRIVEIDHPESGVMLSAIVLYLNGNDAGSGFYKLAERLGELPEGATDEQRLAFWTTQVSNVHGFYGR